MKKVLKIEDLCCANCAAKMEREIEKTDGVNSVSVSFILGKITLDADEDKLDGIIKNIVKIANKIEPDCKIIL